MKRKNEDEFEDEKCMIKCRKFLFEPVGNGVINFCYLIGSDFEDGKEYKDKAGEAEEKECRDPVDSTEVESVDLKQCETVGEIEKIKVNDEDNLVISSVAGVTENFHVEAVEAVEAVDAVDAAEAVEIERPNTPGNQIVLTNETAGSPDSPTGKLRNLAIGNPNRYVVDKSKFIDLLRTEAHLRAREKHLKDCEEALQSKAVELSNAGFEIQARIENEVMQRAYYEIEAWFLKSEEMRLRAESEATQRLDLERQNEQLRQQMSQAEEMMEGVYARMSEGGKMEMRKLLDEAKGQRMEMDQDVQGGNIDGVQYTQQGQAQMCQQHNIQGLQQPQQQVQDANTPSNIGPFPRNDWNEADWYAWHHQKDTFDERIHDRQMTETPGPNWRLIVEQERLREEWQRNLMEEEKRIRELNASIRASPMGDYGNVERVDPRWCGSLNVRPALAINVNPNGIDEEIVESSLSPEQQAMLRKADEKLKIKSFDPFALLKSMPNPLKMFSSHEKGNEVTKETTPMLPPLIDVPLKDSYPLRPAGKTAQFSNPTNHGNPANPTNSTNSTNPTNSTNSTNPNNPFNSNSPFGIKRINHRR